MSSSTDQMVHINGAAEDIEEQHSPAKDDQTQAATMSSSADNTGETHLNGAPKDIEGQHSPAKDDQTQAATVSSDNTSANGAAKDIEGQHLPAEGDQTLSIDKTGETHVNGATEDVEGQHSSAKDDQTQAATITSSADNTSETHINGAPKDIEGQHLPAKDDQTQAATMPSTTDKTGVTSAATDIEGQHSPAEDDQNPAESQPQGFSDGFPAEKVPVSKTAASDTESLQYCAKRLSEKKLTYTEAYSFLQSVCDVHRSKLVESFRSAVDGQSQSEDTRKLKRTQKNETAGGTCYMYCISSNCSA